MGSRHCFNTIADTHIARAGKKVQISLENLKSTRLERKPIAGEEHRGPQPVIFFGAGLTYSELIKVVDGHGLAILNLPSLPHINVVGSMCTATHGSGHAHQIQASMVQDFTMVFADGSIQHFTRGKTPHFERYLLHFGAVGIITEMSIRLVQPFKVNKAIYRDLTWDSLAENYEQIMSG